MNNENDHTYDNGFHPKKVTLKKNYKFYNHFFLFTFFSFLLVYISNFFIFFYKKIVLGFKVKGKKNLKKIKGAITISNHILPIDAFLLVSSLLPKKTYITMLQSNLGFGLFSKYIRLCSAVPIPTDKHLFIKFLKDTEKELKKNKFIHIYPEAALVPYCDHIRNFLPGAFHIAYQTKKPIIPCVYTFHKPKGLYKIYKRKPVVRLNILKPYYPDFNLSKKDCINKTTEDLFKICDDFFKNNSDYYS